MSETKKLTPLGRAVRRVYRRSPQFLLDELLGERSYWQRRQTIATRKLAAVNARIYRKLQETIAPKNQDTV